MQMYYCKKNIKPPISSAVADSDTACPPYASLSRSKEFNWPAEDKQQSALFSKDLLDKKYCPFPSGQSSESSKVTRSS